MTESTFVNPDEVHLADFYDADGSKVSASRFAALAAASLYTSVADMARFLEAQLPGPAGALPGRGVLRPAALESMRMPQGYLYGIPAINTTARVDPATGDGIVVLESGNGTLASEIGGRWDFWQTGTVGIDTLATFAARSILIQIMSGALVILIGGILIGLLGRRRSV